MKQVFLFILIFLIIVRLGYSQTFELGVESGVATFNMSDLKDINKTQQKQLPFETEMTYNFPAYIYYKPMLFFNFQVFSGGMSVAFNSTGSRLSKKDYSGEYVFDLLVQSWSPAIEGSAAVFSKNNHLVQLGVSAGAVFTELQSKAHLILYDSVLTKSNDSLKGKNVFITPCIKYSYTIKSIKIGANVGYFVQLWNNSFYLPSNEDMKTTIKPDWSGLRAGLSVSYLFYAD